MFTAALSGIDKLCVMVNVIKDLCIEVEVIDDDICFSETA
jgi:hypothetical protein